MTFTCPINQKIFQILGIGPVENADGLGYLQDNIGRGTVIHAPERSEDYGVNMKRIEVNYKAGHTYPETWALEEDMYCTNCGKQNTVWSNQGEGDYYHGSQYMCLDCGATANEPRMWVSKDQYDLQRLNKLRMR